MKTDIEKYQQNSRYVAVIFIIMTLLSMAFLGALILNGRTETLKNREVGLTNQFYVRFTACTISTPASQRTKDHIEKCYEQVEKEVGISPTRYGSLSE